MDNPIHLHWLDPNDPRQAFPPVGAALRDPNDLLAIGGDLSAKRLELAYRSGIFPWYNPDEPILWWCPDPRTVLRTDSMHVSRSLRRAINRNDYAMSFNRAPQRVLAACAGPRARSRGTWLGVQMRHAYLELHRQGICQTVEIWRQGELIGGLYGISLGCMFYGESMFSRADDASKITLYWLCTQLQRWNMPLLDCQVGSPHLFRLGAVNLTREEFLGRIRPLVAAPRPTAEWQFDADVPADPQHLGSS
jgi:leucyl/phenylalanyl-tRNA--protein transferase